jgi:hypothetical protein
MDLLRKDGVTEPQVENTQETSVTDQSREDMTQPLQRKGSAMS